MFNLALRILNNREEAEDVLQEAFVDVFTRLDTFRGESTIGAWIRRITANKALNVLRKRKMQFEEWNDATDQREDEVEMETPLYDMATVQQGIKTLPDGYRVVLTLFLLEGYSHKEIAGELGITESTSKSQYNRARNKLKQWLLMSNPSMQ